MRVVCMSNEGGMDMVKNMLTSAKNVGISMKDVDFYKLSDLKESHDFATLGFNHITCRKFECVLDALKKYDEVLWVDSDIIFLRGYCIEDTRSRLLDNDILFQDDIQEVCTGYFLVKKSDRTLHYLTEMVRFMKMKQNEARFNDQVAVNATLYSCGFIKASKLPVHYYPCGRVFFEYGNRKYALMVHNNWIVGNEAKKERFRKNGLWEVNESILDEVNIIPA